MLKSATPMQHNQGYAASPQKKKPSFLNLTSQKYFTLPPAVNFLPQGLKSWAVCVRRST